MSPYHTLKYLVYGLILAVWLAWLMGCIAIHTPAPCLYNGESFTGPCKAREKGQVKYEYLAAKWRQA